MFVDADTWVAPEALERIAGAMNDPRCIGGALGVLHRPRSSVLRSYLAGWRLLGRALRMSQGAARFCRRDEFDVLAGYNERSWIGEDVELQWRLRRRARRTGRSHRLIHECHTSWPRPGASTSGPCGGLWCGQSRSSPWPSRAAGASGGRVGTRRPRGDGARRESPGSNAERAFRVLRGRRGWASPFTAMRASQQSPGALSQGTTSSQLA